MPGGPALDAPAEPPQPARAASLVPPRHTRVLVIGGGLTGVATGARLAAAGVQCDVLEAHRTLGGCSGYFRRSGFAFDVGATTLVDYTPGGAGDVMLEAIGVRDANLEHLSGYTAWIGEHRFDLPADPVAWRVSRARALGDTPGHQRFWRLMDDVGAVFWAASRRSPRLPFRGVGDLVRAARTIPLSHWPALRYLNWTVGDALRHAGLERDTLLRGFLAMVVEDTVHGQVDTAPLVNASLGVAIRGAISRPLGGMYGLWTAIERRAFELGVGLHRSTSVERITVASGAGSPRFRVQTQRGEWTADVLVSTVPIWNTAELAPGPIAEALRPWCERDEKSLGGAALLTLGVPEDEVADHPLTHHQFLPEPSRPLGAGNNCFLSISSPGDELSAPPGHRAAMVTTHIDLADWEGLDEAGYDRAKRALEERLLSIVRRAYPRLGTSARWTSVGTPRTYASFTRRYR
ncbi:MAG: NAD(P)/FAD-dependent oxidoreductase, partial [Phycisphaerales bacterium]|nr:NAD(P)/FAD-dependent oxidoreductase [Phycisphaerales bacterium]